MSAAAPKIDLSRKYTFEEYYEIIQKSETKYEFVDGRLIDIRAMAGGTLNHSTIGVNLILCLGTRLRQKPCGVLNSDMAVRAKSKARYRYPDASVVCTKPEFDKQDTKELVLLNPSVVIEVLSESTSGVDRGEKFGDYRAITSLQQYALVSSDQAMIEVYTRREDGTWLFQYWTGRDATARLSSIGVEIPLTELYAGVEFEQGDDVEPSPGSGTSST